MRPRDPSRARERGTKRWPLPVSLAMIGVGIPALFYLRFGFVDGFAIGVTVFLQLLVIGVEFLPRYQAAHAGEKPPAYQRRRIDVLAPVWLLCIPFAPLAGWVLTSTFDVTAENWRWLVGGRAAVCVVLPVVSVIPLLRFIRRPHVPVMIAVLVLGTGFPVATGLGAAQDVVRGPRWQTVEVVGFRDVDFSIRGTRVHVPRAYVRLRDGRELARSPGVDVRTGSAPLLILEGIGRVVGVGAPPG